MSKLKTFVEAADKKLTKEPKTITLAADLVQAARDCVAGSIEARSRGGRNGDKKGKAGRPITDHSDAGQKNRDRVRKQRSLE